MAMPRRSSATCVPGDIEVCAFLVAPRHVPVASCEAGLASSRVAIARGKSGPTHGVVVWVPSAGGYAFRALLLWRRWGASFVTRNYRWVPSSISTEQRNTASDAVCNGRKHVRGAGWGWVALRRLQQGPLGVGAAQRYSHV